MSAPKLTEAQRANALDIVAELATAGAWYSVAVGDVADLGAACDLGWAEFVECDGFYRATDAGRAALKEGAK